MIPFWTWRLGFCWRHCSHFSLTYDYFFTYHNRNSLDGQGGNIRAAVRIALMDNAYWSGDNNMMFFGDVRPYPKALDVVGHELAHGVTQNAADLVYELQPGALNESFSDIFGEMVEARGTGANDWKMGTHLGMTFRDMANPGSLQIPGLNQPYPSKMSEYINLPNSNDSDHGGVHINSSIPNHAFYLLAVGLPGAIGLQDAEKIFYRCLTQHLQKQSQFVDARLGCIAAAEALFDAGSPQALKTAEAFDAVEIFATPPTPPPTPLPTVEGPDSTLFVAFDPFFFETALGRRETALSDPALGVLLVTSIKQARPSVSGEGSFAIFVDSLDDLGIVNTAPPYDLEALGVPGLVHSVAMSPDGSRFAFVLNDAFGVPDNQITVIDLANETNRTYTLVAPVLDAEAANTVVYADSMVFSADGTQLIYDALSEIHFGSGAQLQRWSIARLNLSTATTTILVPPLEGFDTGNPSLGRAGNRYLTFDAVDVASGNGSIITLDLFTGNAGVVGNVGQGWGYPGFTGDESAVVYAAVDSDFLRAPWTGHSLIKQDLTPDRLTPAGEAGIWLGDAWIGVIYRRGTFAASNALPTVTLTSPTNGAAFPTGAAITILATANDPDGNVAKVEFYNGAAKLGEDTTPGYGLVWNDPPAGTHRLIARAFDNLGGATDSEAVTVTVGSTAPFQLSATRLLGGIRLAATGPPGSYTVQESTNLNSWSDLLPMLIDESGTGLLDDTRTPNPAQRLFYRLRKD